MKTVHEQYKKDIEPLQKIQRSNPVMELAGISLIKQSYLNVIDSMIENLQEHRSKIFFQIERIEDVDKHKNYLKEQKDLINKEI